MGKGTFVVITGPSAVGKTKAVEKLLEIIPNSKRLITTTTRAPRDGEIDKVDYHFLSEEEFCSKEAAGVFLETARTYGNLYGSSRETVEDMLSVHPVVFGILDVKGARAVKKNMPEAVVVFLVPGSMNDIRERLKERNDADQKETQRRAQEAMTEVTAATEFDHIVKNIQDQFDHTIFQILEIVM